MEKSRVYFGGLADREVKQLLNRLQFKEGCFPLRYLGVPLRTTKWKAGDCALIIKKIQLKLHNWSSHHLSFAGRAQLINSVFLSIRSFWMSIFILPKSVLKEVDQLCRNFLWGRKDSNNNRCKMHFTAWDQVCLPKCMGGLGFKHGVTWNKVLLAKFMWVVSFKQDILWVKWIDSIYLKGQDFWSYKVQQDVSWYWKKISNMRDVFSSKSLEEAVKINKISVRILYNRLLNSSKVYFANIFWCSLTVPKHRFIFWQATLGHLLTRDKLQMCNLKLSSVLCPVCEEIQESHAHLFFACSFSHQLRSRMEIWLGRDSWPRRYEDWHSWMVGKPKGLLQRVAAAALAAAVYLIWRNRNKCLFDFSSWSVDYIDQLIRYYVKVRLTRLPKLKVKNNELAVFDYLMQL
ncbi:uncharacterized protein LOC133805584 [Humulus lupulus]|uniref:uncharacterized protein LOC133805584 n=1 Tax=Humulus lupulus TaxID=3486 RepID=UPI002B40CC20|nr:uncharacterized protein LOC133805584 [Humulus lupulus]